MTEYETIIVYKPDLPAEQIKPIQDKILQVIKKAEGQVLAQADWGKRRLAYPVAKFKHAQYGYLQYLAGGNVVAEMERLLKFDDQVLKFLTVKLNDSVDVEARLAAGVQAPQAPEELDYHPARDSYPSDRDRDRDRGDGPRSEAHSQESEEAPESEA